MTTAANDIVAVVSYGLFENAAGLSPPDAPTFTIVAASNTVTVTINGDDGVTNVLAWKKENDTAWTTDSRSGDGDIVVSSLEDDIRYTFIAYSQSGILFSTAAPAQLVIFTSDSSAECAFSGDDYISVYGEPTTIVYLPRGGGSREIEAIVDWEEEADVAGTALSPLIEILVKNNATDGISSNEIDRGGDKVRIPTRIGGSTQDRAIKRILNQDCGMLELEVR
jgi:hypothetical protein